MSRTTEVSVNLTRKSDFSLLPLLSSKEQSLDGDVYSDSEPTMSDIIERVYEVVRTAETMRADLDLPDNDLFWFACLETVLGEISAAGNNDALLKARPFYLWVAERPEIPSPGETIALTERTLLRMSDDETTLELRFALGDGGNAADVQGVPEARLAVLDGGKR